MEGTCCEPQATLRFYATKFQHLAQFSWGCEWRMAGVRIYFNFTHDEFVCAEMN